MMNKLFLISVALTIFLALTGPSHAACTNPGEEAGTVRYDANHSVIQYCNGEDWIAFPKAKGPSWETHWSGPSFAATLNNQAPAAGDQFGNSVAVSGGIAVVGATGDDPGGVSGAGSAYVFDTATGNLIATLNNPAPAAGDYFGYSVAVSGGIAVVGAYLDDPGGVSGAGSAYVFDAATGNLLATLNNPAPAAGDSFGFSVAVSGGIAVVGAYGDDPGGVSDAGTAYVFDAATGNLLATLNNPVPAAADGFGISVAVSAGVAVIGAATDDPGGVSNAGSAYVFKPGIPLSATVNKPAPVMEDYFGGGVAVSGGVAVIGAPGDSPGGLSYAGSAYVFDTATGNLIATLSNPDPAASDLFGHSVAVNGGVTVVGAYQHDPGGVSNAGSAYVFDMATGNLLVTLHNPDPALEDNFGHSVAVSGGVAVIGAPGDSPGGLSYAGSAYVFDTVTGNLIATLNNPDPAANDFFGGSVAVSGGVAVVGAGGDDPGGVTDAGSAYVFDTATGNLIATLSNPDPTTTDFFGGSVAVSGGVAVVGAPWDDPAGVGDAGSAYLFDAATGNLIATLNNPAPEAGDDGFGYGVAMSGGIAVIGSPWGYSGGVSYAGTAYVFDTATGDLIATLNSPTPEAADWFGSSTAISGGVAVIGGPRGSAGGIAEAGNAYIFSVWQNCPPSGAEGEIMFNGDHRVLQWCDGAVWRAAGPIDPPGPNDGCENPSESAGTIIFNDSYCVFQYCDGDAWRGIGPSNPDACD